MITVSRAEIDEAMKFIWDIREQIYEETKDMTLEERQDYLHKKSEIVRQLRKEINPEDCNLSFLHDKKKINEKNQ